MNENQKQDIRNEKVLKRFYIQNMFKNIDMKFITNYECKTNIENVNAH